MAQRRLETSPEVKRAVIRGLVATVVLAVLILLGSRNLAHFDAALVAYTVSVLFATFGLTYRYSMWLARLGGLLPARIAPAQRRHAGAAVR